MDWNLLKSFMAVVEEGSLSAACEKTGISQPTLGRHINELEAQTGITLFIRGRGGMQLTEQAIELVEEARKVQEHVSQFSLKAQGKSEQVSGSVRITASDVVSTYIVPDVFSKMAKEFDQIQVELVVSNEIQNLLTRDADIAIRMVRPTQNDIIASKVNTLHMGAYATRAYLEQYGNPETIQDLFAHRMIGYDRSTLILDTMKAMQIEGSRDMFAYRTDDQVVYWELVRAGVGIGFGPNFIASQDKALTRILPELEVTSLDLWLASHEELKTNIRIRKVMDFLKKEISKLNLH